MAPHRSWQQRWSGRLRHWHHSMEEGDGELGSRMGTWLKHKETTILCALGGFLWLRDPVMNWDGRRACGTLMCVGARPQGYCVWTSCWCRETGQALVVHLDRKKDQATLQFILLSDFSSKYCFKLKWTVVRQTQMQNSMFKIKVNRLWRAVLLQKPANLCIVVPPMIIKRLNFRGDNNTFGMSNLWLDNN